MKRVLRIKVRVGQAKLDSVLLLKETKDDKGKW